MNVLPENVALTLIDAVDKKSEGSDFSFDDREKVDKRTGGQE